MTGGVLSIAAVASLHADPTGDRSNISVKWSPSLLLGKVSLTIINQSSEPISISPHLGVTMSRSNSSSVPPRSWSDKTVINPSVEFILVPKKSAILLEEGVLERPVVIAPGETKAIKLQVSSSVSAIARVASEAIFRLKLGDKVISVIDFKSSTK